MSSTKEITESLGFGVVFAMIKATVDYASGKKITLYSTGKNMVIAAGSDVIYDYGKKKGCLLYTSPSPRDRG